CRLAEALDLYTACGQELFEAVEKYVAARLADVEQPDAHPVEAHEARRILARRRLEFGGGVEEVHVPISCGTGALPTAPPPQPPMMAENKPAPPPACAIRRPPSRNFGQTVPGWHRASGMPSAMPFAPCTISSAGNCSSPSSSSRTRAFDQPASLNTR